MFSVAPSVDSYDKKHMSFLFAVFWGWQTFWFGNTNWTNDLKWWRMESVSSHIYISQAVRKPIIKIFKTSGCSYFWIIILSSHNFVRVTPRRCSSDLRPNRALAMTVTAKTIFIRFQLWFNKFVVKCALESGIAKTTRVETATRSLGRTEVNGYPVPL